MTVKIVYTILRHGGHLDHQSLAIYVFFFFFFSFTRVPFVFFIDHSVSEKKALDIY